MLKRDNLAKLAAYLDTLPDNYTAFNMAVFFTDENYDRLDRDIEERYGKRNGGVDKCGAVACAIGHGPSAGFLVPDDLFTTFGRVNWLGYSDRFFIEGYRDANPCDPEAFAWNWCFGDDWSYIDNTPRGAAKRIRWLLANGVDAIPGLGHAHYFSAEPDHVKLYEDS